MFFELYKALASLVQYAYLMNDGSNPTAEMPKNTIEI